MRRGYKRQRSAAPLKLTSGAACGPGGGRGGGGGAYTRDPTTASGAAAAATVPGLESRGGVVRLAESVAPGADEYGSWLKIMSTTSGRVREQLKPKHLQKPLQQEQGWLQQQQQQQQPGAVAAAAPRQPSGSSASSSTAAASTAAAAAAAGPPPPPSPPLQESGSLHDLMRQLASARGEISALRGAKVEAEQKAATQLEASKPLASRTGPSRMA